MKARLENDSVGQMMRHIWNISIASHCESHVNVSHQVLHTCVKVSHSLTDRFNPERKKPCAVTRELLDKLKVRTASDFQQLHSYLVLNAEP